MMLEYAKSNTRSGIPQTAWRVKLALSLTASATGLSAILLVTWLWSWEPSVLTAICYFMPFSLFAGIGGLWFALDHATWGFPGFGNPTKSKRCTLIALLLVVVTWSMTILSMCCIARFAYQTHYIITNRSGKPANFHTIVPGFTRTTSLSDGWSTWSSGWHSVEPPVTISVEGSNATWTFPGGRPKDWPREGFKVEWNGTEFRVINPR